MMSHLIYYWWGIILVGLIMVFKGPPRAKKSESPRVQLVSVDDVDGPLPSSESLNNESVDSPTPQLLPKNGSGLNENSSIDQSPTLWLNNSLDSQTSRKEWVRPENFDPSEFASVKEMLLTKQAIVLYIISTLTFFAGIFALSQSRNFGELNGIVNDQFLAFIASFAAVFAMMRWVWSWALDHKSFKLVFGLLLALQIFLCFTIFFIDKWQWSYALWIWLFTFCEGGMFVLLPNALKKTFGHKATAMYGFFGSFAAMCSIINLFTYHWLK